MDMRYEMRGDGRRLPPRNARGEFTRRGRLRSRRIDRGIDYGYDMRGEKMRGRRDMGSYPEMDGHHYPMQGNQGMGSTYYPIEAMGRFNGYWGVPEQDYARRDMGYRNYDMRGGDYGYPMQQPHYPPYDYGYGDYGDYGETLSDEELEHWGKKLKKELDEQEKQMFSKEMISQKAKQMNMPMKDFGEKELEIATLMCYTDYKRTIGKNPDMAIRLAYDWLSDEDVAVKGAEKLAVYHDCIVDGEDD